MALSNTSILPLRDKALTAIERQKASDLLRETNENLTRQIQEKTNELD